LKKENWKTKKNNFPSCEQKNKQSHSTKRKKKRNKIII